MINSNIIESLYFGTIMVIFGFITSYITDFVFGKTIVWYPEHSIDMASGTFFTSIIVYILFSERFINYKCIKN